MKKILVIGGNGSGKTTFAKELSKILEIPLVFIDKLYMSDNWKVADENEIEPVIKSETEKDKWIIDGNHISTLSDRLNACDTVFYFDFRTIDCLIGCIKRTVKNYGIQRDDVGGNNNVEKFDFSKIQFLKSVLSFNRNNRKRCFELIKSVQGINLIVLKNRKQVDEYLKSIKNSGGNYENNQI